MVGGGGGRFIDVRGQGRGESVDAGPLELVGDRCKLAYAAGWLLHHASTHPSTHLDIQSGPYTRAEASVRHTP